MGEKVKLTSGTHRRTSDDGTPVVFEADDAFEATDQELEAFGDKLEPVEQDGDEWVPIRSEPGVEEPEDGEYRLLHGTHRITDEGGTARIVEEGDVVELTAQEAGAFADKFEKVEPDADQNDEANSDAGDDTESAAETEGADVQDDADVDVDEEDDSEDVDDEPEEETGDAEIPEELPDDYRELQSLAKEHGVKADQSKADIVSELEAKRDGE
jgi:uncharacterized cupin superfamily protein